MSDLQVLVVVAVVVIGVVAFMMFLPFIPGLLLDRSRINRTDDWTEVPDGVRKTPTMTSLTPYDEEIVRAHLEEDERLLGFGRGFFVPQRAEDARFGSGIEKLPLLVAATSRRLLLFHVRLLTVYRTCFIPYEQIESMDPPKPGLFGTSGKTRFVLKDGREYRIQFYGPLFNDEAMQQEQNMAEQFRRVAERIEAGGSFRTAA